VGADMSPRRIIMFSIAAGVAYIVWVAGIVALVASMAGH